MAAITAAEFASAMSVMLAQAARGKLLRASAPVRCVVAVSGGPDSVALLSLVSEIAAMATPSVHISAVVTVDHGLRGAASAAEASAVRNWTSGVLRLHHETAALAWTARPSPGALQAAARERRYAALADACRTHDAPLLLLGHTADDNAETAVLRWARASGLDGLAAMRPATQRMLKLEGVASNEQNQAVRVVIGRPLLAFRKSRTLATCASRRLAFAVDPSNADRAYDRVRARTALVALDEQASRCHADGSGGVGALLALRERLSGHAAEVRARADDALRALGCADAALDPADDNIGDVAEPLAAVEAAGDRPSYRAWSRLPLAIAVGTWQAVTAPLPRVVADATARLLLEHAAGALAPPAEDRHVRRLCCLFDELHAVEIASVAERIARGLSGDAPTRSGAWPIVRIHRVAAVVARAGTTAAGTPTYTVFLHRTDAVLERASP